MLIVTNKDGLNAICDKKWMNVRAFTDMQTSTNKNSVLELVNGENLLKILFPKKPRPSIRWLKYQKKARRIPFIKIGHLVWFDPLQVRASLNNQVTAKYGGGHEQN